MSRKGSGSPGSGGPGSADPAKAGRAGRPGGPTRPVRHAPRLPQPSPEGRRALGPYARTRFEVKALGLELSLDVPADVFATQHVDDGTLLLLGNLPKGAPSSLLDLGCGYGALSLSLAAKFPQARALLVDRDLLAVRAAAHNARALKLGNVTALPGLGYRDLPPGAAPFDLVLCNVPARIGASAIGHLLHQGRALLRPKGEVRVVIINDLVAPVEAEGAKRGLADLQLVVRGPRHSVYALPPGPGPSGEDAEQIYARDETSLEALPGQTLRLSRPHDVSEDPDHLRKLSVLLEFLPRTPPPRVLVFRCGYGALALVSRTRWPEARVVAQDRDLLDTAFLRRNARALSLDGPLLEVREALFPAEDAQEAQAPALILGELSPSAGEPVAALELRQTVALLAPRGQALLLLSEKQERSWLSRIVPQGASATVLVRRQGASVLRISRSGSPAPVRP